MDTLINLVMGGAAAVFLVFMISFAVAVIMSRGDGPDSPDGMC